MLAIFPQKEHPDFQGWKTSHKKTMDSWILGRVDLCWDVTVYQQLPRLAANHTHFQHLGVIPEIGPNECEPMSCWQENHMFQLGTWVRWHRWHVFTPHDATSALKVWKRREKQKKHLIINTFRSFQHLFFFSKTSPSLQEIPQTIPSQKTHPKTKKGWCGPAPLAYSFKFDGPIFFKLSELLSPDASSKPSRHIGPGDRWGWGTIPNNPKHPAPKKNTNLKTMSWRIDHHEMYWLLDSEKMCSFTKTGNKNA